MITFAQDKGGASAYAEIAKSHANSVRILWRTTDTAPELDLALSNAEAQELIPLVVVYDDQGGPTLVSMVADYWTRPDMAAIARKHEKWLVIVLREKDVVTQDAPNIWAAKYDTAVSRIRNASVNVPLAIDAPNGGLDIDTLLALGHSRIAADPRHNLLLNVNAWWPDNTAEMIRTELAAARDSALPLLIGEFSAYAQPPNCPSTAFAYLTLIEVAQQTATGWLAWSWGAVKNINCPGGYLDMTTDGTYAGLTGWGYNVAFADVNSIQKTSVPATYTPGSNCP
jgi:mannan endo-1,4-beta-mannosidase